MKIKVLIKRVGIISKIHKKEIQTAKYLSIKNIRKKLVDCQPLAIMQNKRMISFLFCLSLFVNQLINFKLMFYL